MPVITIKLYEGRTREQKAELARRITDDVCETIGSQPEHVWITFEDMKRSDHAISGELQDDQG
jgi:4-oxalocrotonate tautomerase